MQEINIDSTLSEIESLLRSNEWMDSDENIVHKLEKPGEGNMNVVIRVITNKRSLILKQSRPYVNKYQDIPAPIERIQTEFNFYNSLKGLPIASRFPRIIGYAQKNFLLAMEDIGRCEDLSYLYGASDISNEEIATLVSVIQDLHAVKAPTDYLSNLELRKLNHQHIFVLPYAENNGFDLNDIQPGLQELSLSYKKDDLLKQQIIEIGQLYLSPGNTLIHGDYYPGSWMKTETGLYVLDPEFSFMGFPEFDLGVMAAHLEISGMKNAIHTILELYSNQVNSKLTIQIAGIEIMRRLIGLAQLPLERNLETKSQLLAKAYHMIMHSN